MKKWVLRILMCVALVGLFCLPAAATEETATASTAIASGCCGGEGDGTNLTWTLYDDGGLVISGTGAMANFAYDSSMCDPSGVNSVTIGEGVTSIGDYAFFIFVNLKRVSLPAGLTYIGEGAFMECHTLKRIELGEQLEGIGGYAFSGCDSLRSVVIPDSVTFIGESAFSWCTSIKELIVGTGVERIEANTFAYCWSLSQMEIPGTIKTIGDNAFLDCSCMLRMEFLGDVPAQVSDSAFADCSRLTIYCYGGITGWLKSEHYNAEDGTWCGCPLVMIPYALTRGNICVIIVDALELTDYDISKLDNPFTDLSPEDGYYAAVLICEELGYIGGYGNGMFDGENVITRAEAAQLFYNAAGCPEVTVDLSAYPDVQNHWAAYAVCWCLDNEIMTTDERGYVNPNRNAYSDEFDFSKLTPFEAPGNTAVQMDISKGSISIEVNAFFSAITQNGETIRTTGGIIVRQSGSTTSNTITVSGGEVEMTLAGVNISSDSVSPISVGSGAHLVLTLIGDNTLTGIDDYGLRVRKGAKLTVKGRGALTAKGDGGIGGGGSITISGGTVTATGGYFGAGIGGGYRGDGGAITITGGVVTATGGHYGAGIGGGGGGAGGTITISGGTVTATGGNYGAGIGGGSGGAGGSVTIQDAEVTASGYYYAIGGGYTDNEGGCDSITISSSTLYTHSDGADCQERIFDLELPASVAALPGSALTLTTVARGASGLTHQWQSSTDNSGWTDVAGQTAATLSIPMTADLDKTYFRCKLTNGFDNVVYTDVAQAYVLAFEKQPTPVEVGVGDWATLEAKSTCGNVTYYWERSYDNGISWNTVPGEIYANLLVNATLSESGALYRCVITATNGDSLASDAVPITVNTDDVTYTVKYYHQLPDGTGYGVAEQAVLVGTPNSSVTAPTKTFDGFVENTAKGDRSGVVVSDGWLVLSRYYDRKEYSITFDMQGGSALPAITARYGAVVTAPASPVRYGYDFGGWYANAELTTPYTFTTMPLNGTTVYAKWVSKDEGRGIEYQINSILLRDGSAYEPVDSIPDGDFLAEVSVTNLSSTQMDTVLFVTYNAKGQMLGVHYAFANPAIGQTMTFGTSIDNDDGQVAGVKVMVLSSLAGAMPLAEAVGFGHFAGD